VLHDCYALDQDVTSRIKVDLDQKYNHTIFTIHDIHYGNARANIASFFNYIDIDMKKRKEINHSILFGIQNSQNGSFRCIFAAGTSHQAHKIKTLLRLN